MFVSFSQINSSISHLYIYNDVRVYVIYIIYISAYLDHNQLSRSSYCIILLYNLSSYCHPINHTRLLILWKLPFMKWVTITGVLVMIMYVMSGNLHGVVRWWNFRSTVCCIVHYEILYITTCLCISYENGIFCVVLTTCGSNSYFVMLLLMVCKVLSWVQCVILCLQSMSNFFSFNMSSLWSLGMITCWHLTSSCLIILI